MGGRDDPAPTPAVGRANPFFNGPQRGANISLYIRLGKSPEEPLCTARSVKGSEEQNDILVEGQSS